ncbi:hypothetical protein B0T16DRAFT_384001 [Cercophora newfieldiana]|uniref:Uncharacterized protein n=1 Tax=Cercophora newfieldiana TaxID=92897 RepID=A0AA40CYC0_9PEZI|nr:hypothetical protein B0T16DRAFT_384001 [Cercophora newfieldiana]
MEMTQFFVGVDFGSTDYIWQVPTSLVIDSTGNPRLRCDDHFSPQPDEPSGSLSFNWIKLALLHQDDQPRCSIWENASRTWRHSMRSKDIIALFLRTLLQPPLMEMQRSQPELDRALMQFNIIFTFPASWGMDDRKRMKEAVAAIGIEDLVPDSQVSTLYLSEQEAAFLSMLSHEKVDLQELVVICDVGGWTLDTAAYVTGCRDPIYNVNPIYECGKARSDHHGALFLHDSISELLRDEIESVTGNRDWLDDAAELPYIMDRLNHVVMYYNGHQGSNKHHSQKVEKIMESINDALNNAKIAYQHRYETSATSIRIVLTGGLSCNTYVEATVVTLVEERYGDSVNLFLPEKSKRWNAVSIGAAMHGLIEHFRDSPITDTLVERTSPAHFFVKRKHGNGTISIVTLAGQGQPIQIKQSTCQIPDVGSVTEAGGRILVVYYRQGNMEGKFCPDREFGFLTIDLLVDGVVRSDLVLAEHHFA